MTEAINTVGVTGAGEIDTRVLRPAQVNESYANIFIAGQVQALQSTALWVKEAVQRAGPYDDTRELQNLAIWLADRIRAVQSGEVSSG